MKLPVFDNTGNEVGTASGSDSVWDASMNETLVHQVVVALQAARRQGTHSTKTRGETSYSTRKLRGQKRSGRARLGSRGSPAMIGGGVAHGPKPRDYRQKLPKKMRRQALRIVLSSRLRDQSVKVVEYSHEGQLKTKPLANLVEAFGSGTHSVALVTGEYNLELYKSSRNISNLNVIPASQLNALDAIKPYTLLITREGVDMIESLWASDQAADDKGDSK